MMEPPSPNWTTQLMAQANECLHTVLKAHPEGTIDELFKNIVQFVLSDQNDDTDVESLTDYVSFSDIIKDIFGVEITDESTGFMGPSYRIYEVYLLAKR